MKQFSVTRADHIEYGFWLVFDANGGVRMTRGRPDIMRNERRVSLTAKIPLSLFKEPELSATITVPMGGAAPLQIDVEATREALALALGVDVDLRISVPEPQT